MESILLNNYNFLTHGIEILAAVTGGIIYKSYKNTEVQYFIFFLIYVAFLDVICSYTKLVSFNKILEFLIDTNFEKNHWLVTIAWDIGAIVFFTFYYHKVVATEIFKNIIKKLGLGFILYSFINISLNFELFFVQFYDSIEVLGAIIIMICSSLYFIEILKSDEIHVFYKSINFYITVAVFLWWIVVTPLTFYDVYFVYEVGSPHSDIEYFKLRKTIYLLANLFMYGTFTFALIYCRPRKNEIIDCK